MKRLFIDTHDKKITVIINDGDATFVEERDSEKSHSEEVIPALERLLEKAKTKMEEIGELIVVNGPGSFTGVRIGVTIAKTIAFDMQKPIKTITSLEMYGVSSSLDFDVVVVTDSKGVYSAVKRDGEYEDFSYRRNAEFENYIETNGYRVLEENRIDIKAIIEYLKDRDFENPHTVNPIYIKEIDALK